MTAAELLAASRKPRSGVAAGPSGVPPWGSSGSSQPPPGVSTPSKAKGPPISSGNRGSPKGGKVAGATEKSKSLSYRLASVFRGRSSQHEEADGGDGGSEKGGVEWQYNSQYTGGSPATPDRERSGGRRPSRSPSPSRDKASGSVRMKRVSDMVRAMEERKQARTEASTQYVQRLRPLDAPSIPPSDSPSVAPSMSPS